MPACCCRARSVLARSVAEEVEVEGGVCWDEKAGAGGGGVRPGKGCVGVVVVEARRSCSAFGWSGTVGRSEQKRHAGGRDWNRVCDESSAWLVPCGIGRSRSRGGIVRYGVWYGCVQESRQMTEKQR